MVKRDVGILRFLCVGTSLALAIPGIVFVLTALASGLSVAQTLDATVAQYTTSRLNLLVTGALGVVPFIAVAVVLALYRRFADGAVIRLPALGGGLAICTTLLWANTTYWPSFLPERVAPMWPHGLELVIGPLFFAPVAALVGVAVGWAVQRAGGAE